jgi:hypothetical protein
MKASRKVIRSMAKTYEPKKGWGRAVGASGGSKPGTVAKTVLKKTMRGKKKP